MESHKLTKLLLLPLLLASGVETSYAGIDSTSNNAFFAQIVSGGGWHSTIVLRNSTTRTIRYRLEFRTPVGEQLNLRLSDGQSNWYTEGSLFAGGTKFVETADGGKDLQEGYARLSTPECPTTDAGTTCGAGISGVTGSLIFKLSVPPQATWEVSIPLDSTSASVSFPYDNSNGYLTALAILNPFPSSGQRVRVQFRSENGGVVSEKFIGLGPRSRTVRLSGVAGPEDGVPGSGIAKETAGTKGTVTISSDSFSQIVAFGLLANPSGALSSLLAINDPLF